MGTVCGVRRLRRLVARDKEGAAVRLTAFAMREHAARWKEVEVGQVVAKHEERVIGRDGDVVSVLEGGLDGGGDVKQRPDHQRVD